MAALKTLDDSIKGLAIRNHSQALRAVALITQARAAELLGHASQSSLSEWSTDHLERACQVLAAFGLKVVPRTELTVSPAELAALKLFARKAMDVDEAVTQPGEL